ncbi:MAG: methyl-accepting chemotaxis protein [Treponema sp.]|jgi:PAS domain S-box-containing protein|nr:methyl-accepting chemotaxis protein [Treponema sp.]
MSHSSKKPVKTDDISRQSQPDPEAVNQINTLKFENAQLRAIQSAMPDPYYVRDMDYNVVLWPDAIAKLTGYTAEEAKKLKCYDMFKACVCPPASQCPTQQCIQVKQFLRDVAVDVYHKSGATVHTLVSNAGVYDDDGNPIGAVEIVKDNTVIQSSMKTIGQIIKNMETESDDLTDVIKKVNSISGAVHEKATESLNSAKTGVQAGSSVYEKCEYSTKHADGIQANMHTINESMKLSVEKISALKKKSEIIIEFVGVIQDIASKTNLLAINASIEAAHAGESGRGFKVVADGIRELSKNSSESAQSIKSTIQEIIGLVKEATTSLNVTEKDFETGMDNVDQLLTHINDMDIKMKVLLEALNIIENAAVTTSQLGEEQNSMVVQATTDCNDLGEIAKNLNVEFDRVFKALQRQEMG